MMKSHFMSIVVLAGFVAISFAAPPSIDHIERSLVASGQGYFPVALRLKDGRIAVIMRGGGPHLSINGRLDIVFSDDDGKTWSKPSVVVDSPLDDRNPAMGQAVDGTIVVGFWRTARYDDQGRYNSSLDKPVSTWTTRSTDGGKTWSEPVPIDVSDISWGSPYGRILTEPDGTMLMCIYGGNPGAPPTEKGAASYLYRSTDNGKTWKRFSKISPGFNETALVRLESGDLLAAMRSDTPQNLWLARSTDGGQTWSKPSALAPANVHPADMILLADHRVLLACGDRIGPFGVRALVGSKEGTFDWNENVVLTADATSRDCGYPSSILLRGGRVLTVYYEVGSKEQAQWGTHCGAVSYQVPPQR